MKLIFLLNGLYLITKQLGVPEVLILTSHILYPIIVTPYFKVIFRYFWHSLKLPVPFPDPLRRACAITTESVTLLVAVPLPVNALPSLLYRECTTVVSPSPTGQFGPILRGKIFSLKGTFFWLELQKHQTSSETPIT